MTQDNKPLKPRRSPPPLPKLRHEKYSTTTATLNRKTIERISLLPPAKERWNKLKFAINDWLAVLDESNYYELLSVTPESGQKEIQQGFHDFSLAFHPDRHREAPQPLLTAATKIFKRGVEAYGVLRRAELKAQYDISLARGQRRFRVEPEDLSGKSFTHHEAQPGLIAVAQFCKTPAGRLHARQAERAMGDQQGEMALELLEKSLFAEGTNQELEDAIAQLRLIANRKAPIID